MLEKRVYPTKVEPQEVDFTLHATLSSLCSAMLNVAGEDAHRNGFGVDLLGESNLAWVLSRMAVEIDAVPLQYTEYNVETWISEFGRVLTARNFALTDAAARRFGRAVTQWCLIDYINRRPVSMDVVAEVGRNSLSSDAEVCERPRKLRTFEPQQTSEHKIVYSDIDFNRHVNTMRYIDMMLDMLPVEMLAAHRPLRLDIHFMHESCLGQTLTVAYSQQGDTSLFEIKRDDAVTACIAAIEWR